MNETSPPISDLVFATIKRWRQGERPDAEAVLQSHPEVRDRKALVIDLIYEEYCLRREHGETFVPSTFVSRFPEYRQSLARMLDAHQFMAEAEESPPLDWPPIGGEFLGFEIVEQIGSSAAAKLYLARETEFGGRLVVIKVSRFGRSEARQLGKLAHPGIVPIHSVREDPHTGMTCVCMPFLGTTTLVDVLDESFASGRQPNSARVFGRLARGYLPAGVDAASWGPVDRFFDSATYEEGVI